jgi:4-amino-4-deoxy-L-arabinose transferase-like glycosyltransferase
VSQKPSQLQSSSPAQTLTVVSILCLSLIFLARLLSLGMPDLVDTTEGRYAGVAQLMLAKNTWITPWIDFHGEIKPYLGKPPLHFWLEQFSFILFGQNNFSARLPSLLSGVGIVATLGFGTSLLLGTNAAVIAMATLATSCLLFFLSGAVVLDVTLTLGITIALISFLLSDRSKIARYTFFIGMALGVLVKGPLATVLVGATIIPWVTIYRIRSGKWAAQLTALPWIRGLLLFSALVLPWYLLAELNNPGFLEYFLWNENFGRYLQSDYGDEYGNGHRQPFGAAFGMMVLACFPWSLIVAVALFAERKRLVTKQTLDSILERPLIVFALAWALSCPVLLLGARQYTGTYLLPSVPGFAFLLGILWHQCHTTSSKLLIIVKRSSTLLSIVMIALSVGTLLFGASLEFMIPLIIGQGFLAVHTYRASSDLQVALLRASLVTGVLYGGAILGLDNYLSENRSTRRILTAAQLLPESSPNSVCLFFPYKTPFSASFYGALASTPSIKLISAHNSDAAQAECPYVIARLKDKDLVKIHRDIPSIQEIKRIGRWRIFQRQ